MMTLDQHTAAFLALLQAGLWEQEARLGACQGGGDFSEIRRLADEQSVMGLVATGLERVTDVRVPKEDALSFAACGANG